MALTPLLMLQARKTFTQGLKDGSMKQTYSLDEARAIAGGLDIDFAKSGFDLDQFRAGLDIEAEHGGAAPATNVTNDDPLTTGKIALAHLNEIPDYYIRLQRMETDAEAPKTPVLTPTKTNREWRLAKRLLIGLTLLALGAISSRFFRKGRDRTS